eukprot:6430625-Alexandrium_andersonii.AAC.1
MTHDFKFSDSESGGESEGGRRRHVHPGNPSEASDQPMSPASHASSKGIASGGEGKGGSEGDVGTSMERS